jgi:hypothetical protein
MRFSGLTSRDWVMLYESPPEAVRDDARKISCRPPTIISIPRRDARMIAPPHLAQDGRGQRLGVVDEGGDQPVHLLLQPLGVAPEHLAVEGDGLARRVLEGLYLD